MLDLVARMQPCAPGRAGRGPAAGGEASLERAPRQSSLTVLAAMRSFLLFACVTVAGAVGGDVNVPKWPPTYNMSLSTIIMPVPATLSQLLTSCHPQCTQPCMFLAASRLAVRQQRVNECRSKLASYTRLRSDRYRSDSSNTQPHRLATVRAYTGFSNCIQHPQTGATRRQNGLTQIQ